MFNLRYKFDENLREVPDSSDDLLKCIDLDLSGLERLTSNYKKAQILSRVGSYFRILNKLDEAESYLKQAMSIINSQADLSSFKTKLEVVTLLRLSSVYQWQQNFDMAQEALDTVVHLCREFDNLKHYDHYILQHQGKLYFDQKLYGSALSCFSEALKIRMVKGDQELIASTEYSIKITKDIIKENKLEAFNCKKNTFLLGQNYGCARKN